MLHLTEFIRQDHPQLQAQWDEIENASSLALLIMNTVQWVFTLAVKIVESELAKRAQAQLEWPECPVCGKRLHSKGWVERQMTPLIGVIRWSRRVGRCPNGCKIGLVAPLDQQLGIEAGQQTSWEVKKIACALAVFVPFEIASVLWAQWLPVSVSATSIWQWVQAMGQREMDSWQAQLEQLAQGEKPPGETPPQPDAPLLIGGMGGWCRFVPKAVTRKGGCVGERSRWGSWPGGRHIPLVEATSCNACKGDV